MANGIIGPHHCVRFFALRSRSPPRRNQISETNESGRWILGYCILPKNNVAKMPAETLLLKQRGLFVWAEQGELIMGYTQALES